MVFNSFLTNRHSLQSFLEEADSPFIGILPNGCVDYINPAATALLGFDRKRDAEKTFVEFCYARDYEMVNLLEGERCANSRYEESYCINDETVTVIWTLVPVFQESRDIAGYTLTGFITAARKKPEDVAVSQLEQENFDISCPIARVLVVEDQHIVASITRQILQQYQCASDLATTGKEALEKVQQQETPFDLILMDVGLPDMSGIAVAQEIRKHLDAKTTTIVALTGNLTVEQTQSCINAGMQAVFSKPLSPTSLKKALGNYVFPVEEGASDHSLLLDLPIIDLEEGKRLVNGSFKQARAAIKLLAHDMPNSLTAINHAAKAGDYAGMSDQLHKLYGALCYCGVPRLRHITDVLYDLLQQKEKDISHISKCLQQFNDEVELFLLKAED